MSFLFGGHLSTDKLIYVHFHSSISSLDWKLFHFHFRFGLELILIPAQTGNETMKLITNHRTSLSVDS